MKTLITNVTVNPIVTKPFKGEVMIEDGTIIEVSKQSKMTFDTKVDGKTGYFSPVLSMHILISG